MGESRICLVVVFNHRFEENVARLEDLYRERFPRRFYLMPFAKDPGERVIRVFDQSYNFHGYFAQGVERFRGAGVSHYVFAADDLLLNPSLNDENLSERLGIDDGEAYIKSLCPLENVFFRWRHAMLAPGCFRHPGFDYTSELPEPAWATERFRQLGLTPRPLAPRGTADWRSLAGLAAAPRHLEEVLRQRSRALPYPMLMGYSDFVVVPAQDIERFAHYCAVFAALNLFAEIAIPTALALACARVRTELRPGEAFFDKSAQLANGVRTTGLELWEHEVEAFERAMDRDLGKLLREFPESRLYVHPVKLSRWK